MTMCAWAAFLLGFVMTLNLSECQGLLQGNGKKGQSSSIRILLQGVADIDFQGFLGCKQSQR